MKKILQFITFIFLTHYSSAQPTFQMRYGSPYRDHAKKVIQTQDGNFIMVGYTDGFGSGGNAMIMKVNAAGATLWIKDYSGINFDIIEDIIELPDTKLVMCGQTHSYGAGSGDAFVMKTDSIGTIVWVRAYGDIYDENFRSIAEDGANGFYVGGAATNTSSLQGGAIVARLDNTGNILWTRWVGDLSTNVSMTPLASGDVILGENAYPNDNFCLWKFSSSGNLVWSNSYLPTPVWSGLTGLSIIESSSGDILVSSSVANPNTVAQSGDNFIVRLDNGGNLISDKSYGGTYSDFPSTISNTSDGGIIMCGTTNSAGNGDNDVSLIKIQANGSVQWAKAYGTVWAEFSSNAMQTADGGFIFTGQTWSVGSAYDSSKVYLVKTDSLGNSFCNAITWYPVINNHTLSISAASAPVNLTFNQDNSINWNLNNRYLYQRNICDPQSVSDFEIANDWNIYPNPFSTTATIETETFTDGATFLLFDIVGQQIKQIQLTNSKTEITRDDLASGIYIYQIVSENKIIDSGKIIVQ